MDRKLNHSLIALSTAGLVLAAALLAGTPVDRSAHAVAPLLDTPEAGVRDAAEDDLRHRRSAKAARRGLALPYFSFAHGMRRIGG